MKFFFRLRQLIGFPVWGQLCCGCQGEESYTCFSGNMLYTLSKVIFYQKLSSVKLVFCQGTSSANGCLLLKGVFRRRSSSSFGSFSFLGFSPECGIAQLSLSLFVSSSWSTSMTSIIFLFNQVHLYDLFCDE